jgi:hypothetical protein
MRFAVIGTGMVGRALAIGSTLAGVLWQRAGWTGVTVGGIMLLSGASVVWLTQRRRALAIVGQDSASVANSL